MKTQGTKLVARIAMALLAGMMVLALASCKTKEEKLVASYLKDYEAVVVKIEKLVKQAQDGKLDAQEAYGELIKLNEEFSKIESNAKYKELPDKSAWSQSDQDKYDALGKRLAVVYQ